MNINEYARKILLSGTVEGADGEVLRLHSNTSLQQAEFLLKHIANINAATTLEVGLAYGITALCIAGAIREIPNAKHYVMDPFQNTSAWGGVGLKNLERSGLRSIVDFREMYAQDALPQLIRENVQVDFAYVDAGKRMDDILIVTHYLGRLLRIGGLIAYDDLSFPGIRKALRYILQQDHFRHKESFGIRTPSLKRRLISGFAKRIPCARQLLASELMLTDTDLGISADCVVIEKIAEPSSNWKWHPACF